MYQELFSEEVYLDEDEIEHVVLNTEEDFKSLMKELKGIGVID